MRQGFEVSFTRADSFYMLLGGSWGYVTILTGHGLLACAEYILLTTRLKGRRFLGHVAFFAWQQVQNKRKPDVAQQMSE